MREIIEEFKTILLKVQIIMQKIKEKAKAISQIATSLKNLDSLRLKEEEKDKTSYLRFRSFFLASQTEGQSFFLFDGTEDYPIFLGLTVLIYQRFIKTLS
jgi:hypothetical protein